MTVKFRLPLNSSRGGVKALSALPTINFFAASLILYQAKTLHNYMIFYIKYSSLLFLSHPSILKWLRVQYHIKNIHGYMSRYFWTYFLRDKFSRNVKFRKSFYENILCLFSVNDNPKQFVTAETCIYSASVS